MATFQQQIKLSRKLNENSLSKDLFKIIQGLQKELIQINKNQLLKSIDSEGARLFSKKNKRGTYSFTTELLTDGKKKAGDPYTLNDSGDFFKGFYIEFRNQSIFFSSKDKKTDLLVSEYGDIFALTNEELAAIINKKILPFFLEKIKNNLEI
jgi:hypothetical protein